MKKLLLLIVLVSSMVKGQEIVSTTFYKDGVETITKQYELDGVLITDIFKDGTIKSRTQDVDGLSVSVGFVRYKRYGQYIAAEVIISNNSSDTFHVIPERMVKGYNINHKGKIKKYLNQKEYQKIVKRRQNGNLALMAFAQGISSINDGKSYSQTSGSAHSYGSYSGSGRSNISGSYGQRLGSVNSSYRGSSSSSTYYSSSTVTYNAAEARAARQERAAQMSEFYDAQSEAFSYAKDSYLKANTLIPNTTTVGHILMSTRGISKKRINTFFVITVNGRDFEFSQTFINLR